MEKGDIDQLRNRLHERINQLRKKRNAPGSSPSSPRSREDILAARNKKKEDRKKAIKAQKEKGNKVAPEELVKFDSKVNKQKESNCTSQSNCSFKFSHLLAINHDHLQIP